MSYNPGTRSLAVNVERVQQAAAACPIAKQTLEALFPEAFPKPAPHGNLNVLQHADITEVTNSGEARQRFVVLDVAELNRVLQNDPTATQLQVRIAGSFGVGHVMRAFKTLNERVIARNGVRL